MAAEREQGITIDVAYRFFSTQKRSFIVADTPGHEQYTRNMVTGASTADLAILLVDARKGILIQTRRHSLIAAMLGIRHVVLAVNKMDLVGYSQDVFERITTEYRSFAAQIGLGDVTAIPLSALKGDCVIAPSAAMPWYAGPTLLAHLENVEAEGDLQAKPLRLPVQWVSRPDAEFRGYAGLVVSGSVSAGERVRALPSGQEAHVVRLVSLDGDLGQAVAGQSVMLVIDRDIDISRGEVIAAADHPPSVADQFQATLVWMGEERLLPGRPYALKLGTKTVTAAISELRYRIDVNNLAHIAAKTLECNEIGVCNLALDQRVAFDAYADNRDTGGFILIDRITNATVAAGMLHFALRRSQNLRPQILDIDKAARSDQKGQRPCILWFTGLSGAGKSTIANIVEKKLQAHGRHTYLLDGDNIRLGLNRDLGFTDVDRVENIRRVAEVARLMVDAGLIVLVSFISPFRAERHMARGLVEPGEFLEIFVDLPLELAEKRDTKGLYAKARAGKILNFTGIDSPYEPPLNPDVRIDSEMLSADQAAELILERLAAQRLSRD